MKATIQSRQGAAMQPRPHPPRAFTLIEMLTVVAIIAMLMALLFPAISKAIRNAQIAKAQTTVNGLAIAFRAYYTEYGQWPQGGTESAQNVTTNLLSNPRNIVFFDWRAKEMAGGAILNPWGTNYWVAFDANYDNSTSFTTGAGSTNIASGVAVWTQISTSTNKLITSW